MSALKSKNNLKAHDYEKIFKCRVVSISHDIGRNISRAYFPEGNCCDMTGCIDFFKSLDDDVKYIFTFSGTDPDTAYAKKNGEWVVWPHGMWKWNDVHDLPVVEGRLVLL